MNQHPRWTAAFFFFPVFLLIFWVAAPARSQILTLEEALRLGTEENRLSRNAAIEVDKMEDQIAAARTKRYPSFELYVMESRLLKTLDFEFKKGVFGDNPVIGPIPAEDTDISTEPRFATYALARVTQPLSQQYRIGLGIEFLEISRDLAREALRIRHQTVANEIRHSYFEILSLQNALAAARETVSFYRELRRVVDQFIREGVALSVDGLEVDANLSGALDDERTVGHAIRSRKEELNRLMGRDIETAFEVAPIPEPAPFEVDGGKSPGEPARTPGSPAQGGSGRIRETDEKSGVHPRPEPRPELRPTAQRGGPPGGGGVGGTHPDVGVLRLGKETEGVGGTGTDDPSGEKRPPGSGGPRPLRCPLPASEAG